MDSEPVRELRMLRARVGHGLTAPELLERLDRIIDLLEPPILAAGDLVLREGTVTVAGIPVRCTPTDRDILELLLVNRGRVVTRRVMIDRIWQGRCGANSVEVAVSGLRRRIGFERIDTVRGVGYRIP